jgi:hypothetical protein
MSKFSFSFAIFVAFFLAQLTFAQSNAGLDSTLRWGYSGQVDLTQVDGIEIRFVSNLGDVVNDRVASVVVNHPLNADSDGKYSVRLGDHFAQVPNGTYDIYIRNWSKGNRSPWAGPVAASWSTDIPPTPETPEIAERGSALLSWSAPTINDDGTSLTDLAGYVVYRWMSEAPMTLECEFLEPTELVSVGNNLSYRFNDLKSGRHWFYVTAVDTSGNESDCSEVVYKDV